MCDIMFIDDLAMIVANRSWEDNVKDLHSWVKDIKVKNQKRELSFAMEKRELIHFNKGQLDQQYTGIVRVIWPTAEIWWLGVWIHQQLHVASHIHQIVNKVTQTLNNLKILGKLMCGLEPTHR